MSCPEETLLSAYADGALSGADRDRIVDHLRSCDDCRATVDADERLARALVGAVCPAPETLALFVDDALAADRMERTAAHVLTCDPCRDVVSWTRDAHQQVKLKRATGRRRRPAIRRREAPVAPWIAAGLAAAAALLLLALWPRRTPTAPTPGEHAQKTVEAPRIVLPGKTKTEAKTGLIVDAKTGQVIDSKTGLPVESKTGLPVETKTEAKTGEIKTGETKTGQPKVTPKTEVRPQDQPRPQPRVAVVAMAGSLTWQDAHGKPRPLRGSANLPLGTRIASRRAGSFRVGTASLFLQGPTTIALRGDGLSLERGQLIVDAPSGATAIRCGEATLRAGQAGARVMIETQRGGALLCVLAGKADVTIAASRHTVLAGQARLVRGKRLRPAPKPTAVVTRARAVAEQAVLAGGIDAPRGIVVQRVLNAVKANLAHTDVAKRAEAALVVESVLHADPRLARLASALAPAAHKALEGLVAQPPAQVGPLADTILALASHARRDRKIGKLDRERLIRLGKALASLPASQLSGSARAILALRAIPGTKPPRALVRRQLRRVAATTPRLAADPLVKTVPAGELLALWTPALEAKVFAHAVANTGAEAELALVLSHLPERILRRRRRRLEPASVVAVPTTEGYRVTFVFRHTKLRPRSVHLCGEWDNWNEQATPMRKRKDGSFVVTIELPAKRYEYKLRLDSGDWTTDPRNPLRKPDKDGNVNSVLILD